MTNATRPRVLYVSDSLGTPIHPRGIFNYSVALVEILKSQGFAVTLLVERGVGHGVGSAGFDAFAARAPDAANAMRLAEIYRYFGGHRFSYGFEYETPLLRRLAAKLPGAIRLRHRIAHKLYGAPAERVANDKDRLDYVPAMSRHLTLFDNFLVQDGVYSRSMLRAVNRTGPVPVDASGFDLVIVDTPHYVTIGGIAPGRIVSVVHDVIPLQDPTLAGDWRLLFLRKVEATIALGGALIFVSETTRQLFFGFHPGSAGTPSCIIHPPIRAELMSAAGEADAGSPLDYLAAVETGRREKRLTEEAQALPEDLLLALALGQIDRAEVRSFLRSDTAFDPRLPYFATVVSDEPRKNIGIFVAIAERFRGRANFVIIGQVDGNRHMGGEPDRYPNLHFTGYVTDREKLDLVRGCAGLIFSSFSEGFGIPVVEGALFGRPVICSDIPVFREITAGYARTFDPASPDGLVDAVEALLLHPEAASADAEALRAHSLATFAQSAMADRLRGFLSDLGIPVPSAPPRAATAARAEGVHP